MDWLLLLQIIGVVLGLLYLYLEFKANIWLWFVGLIMPVVHSILYFSKGLYADGMMEVYYVFAGLYGWIVWRQKQPQGTTMAISHTPAKITLPLVGIYALLHAALFCFLYFCTDSTVPFFDSMTTALSMIAMWMLSRKYVEQWLVWLVVDVITVFLYFYKEIPITACLYAVYSALAIVGYWRWNRLARVSASASI
ncbi:MAG: nicotinamide mononucleotide transporter [Paludibacteraceae bacterium]|jgi:nicotinamide mononucleotide transporter|nr:nicotinamide mononucleotide transporter [Paludibacteraceae bacterium]MED9995950.1 nicotinamide riboside transporter PnuC [Paludibacteraceae bacterium]